MGAGSIRIMWGEIGGGKIEFREVHRFQNEIVEKGGHQRWEMERITGELRRGFSRVREITGYPPQSVGVDSWGVDFVMLDSDGELLEDPVAYRDERTDGMQDVWETLMSRRETFRRTGINFYVFNTLFQLLSLRGLKVMENTRRILFMPCYINYLLSGTARNERTIASTSQLLSVTGDRWDPEVMSAAGLREELFGKVIAPGTKLGRVILEEWKDARVETVAVSGHDTACVVASLPVEDPDFAFISAGTWCIVGVESTVPLLSDEALKLGLTNERGYPDNYRCLKNIVGLWLIQGLKQSLPGSLSYERMEQMVTDGKSIPQVINPDDPLFFNPGDMKEAFDTFISRSGQTPLADPADYIRCAYDSLCLSFRYHLEQLENLTGRPVRVLHLVGGGSQSVYLCQHTANMCERKVVAGPVEGAVMGNILIQAISMGTLQDLEEGRRLVKHSPGIRTFMPGPAFQLDQQRYQRYVQLITNQT